MLLKSSKSCFYNKGPNSQTLVGFGNFPKFKNLSQIFFQNPRNWENSQTLDTLITRECFNPYMRTDFNLNVVKWRFETHDYKSVLNNIPAVPADLALYDTKWKMSCIHNSHIDQNRCAKLNYSCTELTQEGNPSQPLALAPLSAVRLHKRAS